MTQTSKTIDSDIGLIGIVREEKELVALLNSPRALTGSPETNSENQNKETTLIRCYETTRHSLSSVPQSICPLVGRLINAWNIVSESQYLDRETFDSIALLLQNTVPALLSPPQALRPLTLQGKEQRYRATAARPRAYKGTRTKPPKSRQPDPQDLRLYLSSLDGSQKLWEHIHQHLPQSFTHIERRADATRYQPSKKTDQGLALSMLIQGLQKSERSERWSPLFLQYLAPGLHRSTAAERRECLGLFYALNLESDLSLLAGISRILWLGGVAPACLWGKVVQQQPVERRVSITSHIIEEKCCAISPDRSLTLGLDELNRVAVSSSYNLWIRRLLIGWRQGTPMDYLVAGFKLAGQFLPSYEFSVIGKCRDFPAKLVEDLACYFPNTDSALGFRLLRAWERSAQLNNFTRVLRDISWFTLPPKTAYRLFKLILDVCWYYEDSRQYRRIWDAFQRELHHVEHVVGGLPMEYQARALDELEGYACQHGDPSDLQARLHRSYQLLPKTCCPPHDASTESSAVVRTFLFIKDQTLWARFLNSPSSSFRELDHIAQRNNEERLVAYGVHAICEVMPAFAVRSFGKIPRSLFRAGKTLGCLSYPVRVKLLHELADHPLFTSELEFLPILDACKRLLDTCESRIWNPMPHYLKRWARGEYHLSQKRVTRYFQICFDNLDRARLDLIEQQALARLCRGLPKIQTKGAVQHAVQLLGAIDHNRRGLRRFLHAYWTGHLSYLEDHPATQAWLKRHPKIRIKIWKQGLQLKELNGPASIELKIEDDPLEVLKMGTYVGSCLGLGGICADSSAAVLLDINKQVVYARDQHGKVLGRQLLAISKNDELVCFSVYPLNLKSHVQALFMKYDRAFAKALGLPLYQEEKDGNQQSYEIEDILSDNWWDDGPWGSPVLKKKRNKSERLPTKLTRVSNL